MHPTQAISIEDLRRQARRALPRIVFDFLEGGVEGETGIDRNAAAFRQMRLLPAYFRDVSATDTGTTLFGRRYGAPFGICPTGVAGLFRPGADEMLAEAAAAADIPFLLSIASSSSLRAVLHRAPRNTWCQFYDTRDKQVGERQIARIRDAGIETLVITVDVPVVPRRERNMRNGFTQPFRMTPSIVLDGLLHPVWLARYLRAGGRPPEMPSWAAEAPPGASVEQVIGFYNSQIPAADQSWHDLERYRRLWPGRLVVKGLMRPDDARRAAEMGADGIIVSNHGARQLDIAPAPVEVLPAIVAAVGERVAVMLDSGIRRGSDVLLALSLGARFAFVGRATLYGVAAFGQAGAHRAVSILQQEVALNLAQLGHATPASLAADAGARFNPGSGGA